jgi:hypothetical protein
MLNNKFLKVKGLASYIFKMLFPYDFPCCGFSGFHLFGLGKSSQFPLWIGMARFPDGVVCFLVQKKEKK